MNTIQLKTEKRQRLYYQQYRYAIELGYPGFEFLDRLEPEAVLAQYNRRSQYSWRQQSQLVSIEQILLVATELADVEQKHPDAKAVNSWHTRFYYTNSDTLVYRLACVPEIQVRSYRQADVCLPDGVIIRKNNPYQYRTYFRERKIDPERGAEFLEAVRKYGDYFSMNDTTRLRLAMNRHHYPFSRHSYIDHHSEHDRVMLEMLLPGYLGRTLPIQAK